MLMMDGVEDGCGGGGGYDIIMMMMMVVVICWWWRLWWWCCWRLFLIQCHWSGELWMVKIWSGGGGGKGSIKKKLSIGMCCLHVQARSWCTTSLSGRLWAATCLLSSCWASFSSSSTSSSSTSSSSSGGQWRQKISEEFRYKRYLLYPQHAWHEPVYLFASTLHLHQAACYPLIHAVHAHDDNN